MGLKVFERRKIISDREHDRAGFAGLEDLVRVLIEELELLDARRIGDFIAYCTTHVHAPSSGKITFLVAGIRQNIGSRTNALCYLEWVILRILLSYECDRTCDMRRSHARSRLRGVEAERDCRKHPRSGSGYVYFSTIVCKGSK